MKKVTLLSILVVLLLIVNVVTLGFIAFGSGVHSGMPMHPEPREIIKQKLHFTDAQEQEYEVLIQIHRKEIRGLDEKIRDAKVTLYETLGTNGKIADRDSLINVISSYQKEVEWTHYNHFAGIKALCTPAQLADFDALTAELPQLFGPPQGPPAQQGPPR